MNQELSLSQDFGPHLANGEAALEYRRRRIDPYVEICKEIVLDFTGVRNANSSFMNALVCGAVEQHGEKALKVLTFKGCNPVVRILAESAIDLGLQKIKGRIDA